MKKVIIILILIISFIPFILRKNDYLDITKVIYVSSLGIDYNKENNEFIIYSYILNKFNLAQSNVSSSNIDNLSYVVKTSSTDFNEAFNKTNLHSNVYLKYDHLQTIILTTNFFTPNNIKVFYSFMKDNTEIYPTTYLFTTQDKMSDIYNIKNFSDVSAYHTILISPNLIKNYKLVTFQDFALYYHKNSYTLKFPNIGIVKDEYYQQDKPYLSIKYNGFSFLDKFNGITFYDDSFKGLMLLTNLEGETYKFNNYDLFIKRFKVLIRRINDKINIIVKLNTILTYNYDIKKLSEIEKQLTSQIEVFLMGFKFKMDQQNIDVFNLNYLFKEDNFFFKETAINYQIKLRIN